MDRAIAARMIAIPNNIIFVPIHSASFLFGASSAPDKTPLWQKLAIKTSFIVHPSKCSFFNTTPSFFHFLMKPLTLMKLFLFLLLLISTLQPEYLESTSFIRCSRHFYSSVFFSIPTDTLLLAFLEYSQELRDFCDFDAVPDGSKFTRFKQDFLLDLRSSKTLDFVMLLFLSVPILA
jgi:transposase domain (DUF772)